MKNLTTWAICNFLFVINTQAQDWIPQGQGMVTAGYVILSISVVNDSVIWATASESSVIINSTPVDANHLIKVLRSIDGGETWLRYDVEEAKGRISFDIMGIDMNTAWITTTSFTEGGPYGLFKTENGGIAWTNKLNNPSGSVFIRKFDDLHLFVQTNKEAARSEDGGENWNLDTIQGYLPNEYNTLTSGTNMASVIGDTLWVGTVRGRVVRYTNYGASYKIIYTGYNNAIMSMSFIDHLRGMIVYYNTTFGTFGLLRTFDGGDTWEFNPSKPQTNFVYNITHVPGTQGTFITTTNFISDAAEYFWTTDFGETWTNGGEIEGARTNSIQFISPTQGWVSTGITTSDSRPLVYKWNSGVLSGIHDKFQQLSGLTVVPNPATDNFQYDYDEDAGGSHLEIVTDLEGRVHSMKYTSDRKVDITSLPAGIYFLHVESNGRTGTSKFVKVSH